MSRHSILSRSSRQCSLRRVRCADHFGNVSIKMVRTADPTDCGEKTVLLWVHVSARMILAVVNTCKVIRRGKRARTTGDALRCAAIVLATIFAIGHNVEAQRRVPITGDRISGFVLPIEPITGDIQIRALRASAWSVDDTKRLLLGGDVQISIGAYTFQADAAAVWINRIPSKDGLINQIAMYFDRVDDPTRRAGLGVRGNQVLVTGSARGAVALQVSLLENEQPPATGLLGRADRRLAVYLRATVDGPPPPLGQRPHVQAGQPHELNQETLPTDITLPPREGRTPPLLVPNATVWFTWDRLEVETGEEENTVTLTGSVVVEYSAIGNGPDVSQLMLSAQRAVVFTDPGSIEEMMSGRLEAESIRGIYLEGNVNVIAEKGQYQVRAPQVYYDFRTGRAIMLNAVMRTYANRGRLPVYIRAVQLRQIAANQWTGNDVRVSASEFFTPHLSIGAERVTVTRDISPDDPGDSSIHLDSRGNTVRLGNTPVVYWPKFSGSVQDIPLRSVSIGTRDNDGVRVETTWDAFSLLGLDQPKRMEADLRIDGFSKRGAGFGLDFSYELEHGQGSAELYGLYDDGVDRTSSGREDEHNEEYRGDALWEHIMRLDRDWMLQAQAAWISDETFITAWREDDFVDRREYETSLYLKRVKGNEALTVLGKTDLNDFVSNSYLLASRQLQVERLPEVTYRRFGDSWFNDTVTYSGETRVSRLRFSFEDSTPRELGVRGRAFGIDNDTPVSDSLLAAGLTTNFVNRFDSRHEVVMPLSWGNVKIAPFLVGRFTAYDDDFKEFSSDADSQRMFGAAGVRFNTQFQRIDNSVENRLFDLHRLRHIIEPSLLLWYGYADVDQADLPLYDPAVESLATGSVVQLALRNTWQTQRGGPGRWQSADVLTIDTALVLHSGDGDRESPTPQFFDYRPEYSQFGDHVQTSFQWLPSDHLSFVGEATYDTDDSTIARGSIGTEIRHSPLLRTFVEYRYIDVSENELLAIGWDYQLTPKYRVSLRPDWDLRADEFRAVQLGVTRSFPDFDFTIQIRHDEIRDDTTLAASMDLAKF